MVTYWRHWGLWKKPRWLNKDTGKAYTALQFVDWYAMREAAHLQE